MTDVVEDHEIGESQSDSNRLVNVQSADGAIFSLPIAAASLSFLIKDALPEHPDEDEEDEEDEGAETEVPTVELMRVSSECLAKVVEWMNHYHVEPMHEIPCPLGHNSFDEVVTQSWYADWCHEDNMPRDMLFEVLRAANYMSIPPLLDLACLKVTFQLHGRNADEVRLFLVREKAPCACSCLKLFGPRKGTEKRALAISARAARHGNKLTRNELFIPPSLDILLLADIYYHVRSAKC